MGWQRWCHRDGLLTELEEQSSKEDQYQFTRASWAASAFSLNLVCCLLGLSKENFFFPFVSRLILPWAKIPDYVIKVSLSLKLSLKYINQDNSWTVISKVLSKTTFYKKCKETNT